MNDETDDMWGGLVVATCLVCSSVPMLAALACLAVWLVERL